MLIKELLKESLLFKDNVTLIINPDKDDPSKLADKLLEPLTQFAYWQLIHEKNTHEKKFGPKSDDEDAYNFEFTQEALQDKIENVITQLCNELEKLDHSDFILSIDRQKNKFKYSLDKTK